MGGSHPKPMVQRVEALARYNLVVFAARLLDHFQNPRNPGEVAHPDASAELENPACGDILKLTLRMEGDRISEIRFLAKGCVPAMACASAVTELVQGKTLEQVGRLRREDLIQAVGGLPEASAHAGLLAMDVLRRTLNRVANQPRIRTDSKRDD
jgi:nitrogen fixation protein NifU and related proteins